MHLYKFSVLLLRNLRSTTFQSCSYSGGRIQVGDNVELCYEKTGDGKHALLLIPGALGSAVTDFGPQMKSLDKEQFTVVSYDPRGYGRSIPPKRDFPLDFFYRDADDAVALMKSLQLPTFSALGWSDGGNIAAIMAARYPENVNKLVVWGSNSYVTKEEIESYNIVRDISKWSPRMRQPMIEMYGKEYFQATWSAWIDACQRIYKEQGGDIYKCELKKIIAPTLIIHGMKDALVPKFQPDYLHDNIKGSEIVFWPEGKHNLHLRYANEFKVLVEEFLLK